MHRFYCSTLAHQLQQVTIDDPGEVHHLSRVMRLHAGDVVELINGRGGLGRVRLLTISKTAVVTELLDFAQAPAKGSFKSILACALPKRSAFDDIIEKCTELGVDEIIPLITDRTEKAPSKAALLRMSERFSKVVLSASKQCKRLWFPVIHSPMTSQCAVDRLAIEGNALFFPWLEGERRPLKDAFADKNDSLLKAAAFFIGPEGDFTPAEAAYAISHGAIPVSLGETVLRVETAAVAVIAYAHLALLR